jgi:multisubunit Na+/H+ antiporter MnhB subunit
VVVEQTDIPPLAVAEQPALIGALLAIVVPLTILVALHLLKAGSQEPGGAFQAGAVLAAAGVLLLLAGRVQPSGHSGLLIRLGLGAGLISFSLIGLAALPRGEPLLALPGLWAIYLIETAMMLSIALTLVLLFAGAGGLSRHRP